MLKLALIVCLSLLSSMFSYRLLTTKGNFLRKILSCSLVSKNHIGFATIAKGPAKRKNKKSSSEIDIDTSGVVNGVQENDAKETVAKRKKKFTLKNVPEETLYIIDGTAMLYAAYYSNEYNYGYNGSYFTPEMTEKLLEGFSPENIELVKQAQFQSSLVPNLHDYTEDKSATIESVIQSSASPSNEAIEAPFQLRCGAITAMIMYFARLIRDVKPKYVAVVFDQGKETFRNLLLPTYKQTRTQSPPELWPLFGFAPSIYESLGCKCLMQSGFEADDVMASLSTWARSRGLSVVHVSRDKDMLQLVDTGVYVLQAQDVLMSKDEVIEKYDVLPSQFCDYQAIIGDSADNIPGVKGIGPKVAPALIKHFGSVENMFDKIHLNGVKAPSVEVQNMTATNPLLLSEVKSLLGKEKYDDAIAQLTIALKDVRGTGASTLMRLYQSGHENIKLYKYLVTLKTDLPIKDCLYSNSEQYEKFNNSNKIENNVEVDASVETGCTELNSSFFLYNGEDKSKHDNDVEGYFKSVSDSFLRPLQLLREQYHKLV